MKHFFDWIKGFFTKKRPHGFLWATPSDMSQVAVTIYRWDTVHRDGTRLHSVNVHRHPGTIRQDLRPIVAQHYGISAARYRELLKEAKFIAGDGKIRILKSRLINDPDPVLQKAHVQLKATRPFGADPQDTWFASYWNLVDGVWLFHTFEDSCIRATLGHVLEHADSEQINIKGYRNAGITIDRDDASITYALFRDSYGILGVVPENWETDGEIPDELMEEMPFQPPKRPRPPYSIRSRIVI